MRRFGVLKKPLASGAGGSLVLPFRGSFGVVWERTFSPLSLRPLGSLLGF